jgi:predicted nucleotidyltransferase
MTNNILLWRSLVGSHAFGTNHAGSDYDVFSCYVVDSDDLLAGRVGTGNCHVSEGVWSDGKTKMDVQSHELSRWLDGALSGNLNYTIGILSPIVLEDPYGFLRALRRIVEERPTTALLASTLGMARSNLKKFEMHERSGDDRRALKNLRTSIRSIWFARRFIEGARGLALFDGMLAVNSIPDDMLFDQLKLEMALLEELAERSSLPSHGDPEPYRQLEWLIRYSMLSAKCHSDESRL